MEESREYLGTQLITYLGNKRALLPLIEKAVLSVKHRMGLKPDAKLTSFDVFSGSGIVARFLKKHSSLVIANDLEEYSRVINSCYLANPDESLCAEIHAAHEELCRKLEREPLRDGLISRLYAPKDSHNIGDGERAFYTSRNARYLDTARQLIGGLPEQVQAFLLAPLLSEASVHANTSGVFKGFYKNKITGRAQFGGHNRDALSRITGDISLPHPVFSRFASGSLVLKGDANTVCASAPEVDLAYLDPPYNQHPYGSNYFMLNLLCAYAEPDRISPVSGIPADWQRSRYNRRREAESALVELICAIKARFVLVSFNSEGFIPCERMLSLLRAQGQVSMLETPYNAFRGSRNLSKRATHVREYLFILEKGQFSGTGR